MNTTTRNWRTPMAAVPMILSAAIAASSSSGEASELPPTSGAPYAMTVEIQGSGEGFVAGQPGRVSIYVDGNSVVLRVGGEPVGGIYRETYEVRAARVGDLVTVTASVSESGVMRLVVVGDGGVSRATGRADMDMLEQVVVMEEFMGVTACADAVYVGTAPEECVVSAGIFGGGVTMVSFRTPPTGSPAAPTGPVAMVAAVR